MPTVMEIEALSCNNCGALLDVPAVSNFVTCAQCGSRLAVRRERSVHNTETIEQSDKPEEEFGWRRATVDFDRELEKLRREWREERREYWVRSKGGILVEPTTGYVVSQITWCVGMVALTIIWFIIASPSGAPALFFGWIGVIASVIALAIAIYAIRKASKYRAAKEEYQRRIERIRAGIYSGEEIILDGKVRPRTRLR